jgi:hypothetical protein
MTATAEMVWTVLVSTAIMAIIAWVRSIGCKTKATYEGVTSLLYVEIKRLYYQAKTENYCPLYILEDAEELFKAYHTLGGNGAIQSVMEELRKMPRVKERKEE